MKIDYLFLANENILQITGQKNIDLFCSDLLLTILITQTISLIKEIRGRKILPANYGIDVNVRIVLVHKNIYKLYQFRTK